MLKIDLLPVLNAEATHLGVSPVTERMWGTGSKRICFEGPAAKGRRCGETRSGTTARALAGRWPNFLRPTTARTPVTATRPNDSLMLRCDIYLTSLCGALKIIANRIAASTTSGWRSGDTSQPRAG